MQRSYKDVLCDTYDSSYVNKHFKKKCRSYTKNDGCWRSNKTCTYYHKPLFHFDNPIIVFQCFIFQWNSNIINEESAVTTKNGITFNISGYDDFQLSDVYKTYNHFRWYDDYCWGFDTGYRTGGDSVENIIIYMRQIVTTIRKIFLIKNIKGLPSDIARLICQQMTILYPKYYVYPIQNYDYDVD